MKVKAFIFLLFTISSSVRGQFCNSLNLQLESEITSSCSNITMTSLHDQLGRGYLYIANKSLGLTIYNISDLINPIAIDTIQTHLFDTLDVMNLSQSGNYLFLALGNHFTNPQKAGMAIIDITDPSNASVLDFHTLPNSQSGSGVVIIENDLAYLGAMRSGVVIFDVSNKSNINFISQYIPDINYPVNNPNPDLYNARGMVVKDSIVYLCYDAGGLRIINCKDPQNPIQTGKYSNSTLHIPLNLPRAYNNIALKDSFAFVAIDYCGIEVLNLKDTSNITLTYWWNPYGCPNNNWFSSPSHTNELYYDRNCELLYTSTGKSDLIVLDVSDPTQIDSCNYFGGVSNNIGTWGVSGFNSEIYLSYICAIIPFSSNWSGIKLLSTQSCPLTIPETNKLTFDLYPNPTSHTVKIVNTDKRHEKLQLYDISGILLLEMKLLPELNLNLSDFPKGVYLVKIGNETKKLIRH
ncbi:MAG: T9SS type A sorting domain-containing protein [Flavobacteriales bacterium]|nr:T9SS type A sorting domain-containing protein [Flavobacteriales bacterium]